MKNDVDEVKVQIMLKEFETLKSEIKYFFNIQFSLIGFWLVFISALVGYIFSSIDITDREPSAPFFIYLILMVLIPGVCDVLGLVWLDFTTRIVKAAHYLFLLENRFKDMFDDDNYILEWEHYVFKDSQREKLIDRVYNYFYYCFMLGIFFIVPPFVCLFTAINTKWIFVMDKIFIFLLITIELVTIMFAFLYVKRILSYSEEKKNESDVGNNIEIIDKLKDVVWFFFVFVAPAILSIFLSVWLVNQVVSFLALYDIFINIFFKIAFIAIVTFFVILIVWRFVFALLDHF